MSTLPILLTGIVITAVATWYVTIPLLSRDMRMPEDKLAERKALLARYEFLLRAILDLEADYQVGKVAPEDYALLSRQMKLSAAKALMEMKTSPSRGEPIRK